MARKKQKQNSDTGGGGGGGGEEEEEEEEEKKKGENRPVIRSGFSMNRRTSIGITATTPMPISSPPSQLQQHPQEQGREEESKPTDQAPTQWPLWRPHEDQSFYWCFCEEKKDYALYPVWYYDEKRSIYWYFSGMHNACLMYEENAWHGEERADGRDQEVACLGACDSKSVPENFPHQNDLYSNTSYKNQEQNYEVDELPGLSRSGEPLPSGWVEEVLIEAYLGGSWNSSSNGAQHVEENNDIKGDFSGQEVVPDQQQFPLIMEAPPEACLDLAKNGDAPHGVSETDASEDILAWQDQYGQVVRTNVKINSSLGAINLWHWTTSTRKKRNRNRDSICLVGQLVANKSDLHPSLQHHNSTIKTSEICEVNLDLVKVSSGEVYRLRQPSYAFLTSVTKYDSSNPTKDWDFPCLNVDFLIDVSNNDSDSVPEPTVNTVITKPFSPNLNHQRFELLKRRKDKAPSIPSTLRVLTKKEVASAEERKQKYRDRAKERRDDEQIHGKLKILNSESTDSSRRCPTAECMLKKMGWSEGKGLGKRRDGIVQPLQGLSNTGRAGIGWVTSNSK